MKKKYYFIIFILFTISSLQAQTTSGKEFWLTFGKFLNSDDFATANSAMQIRIVTGNLPASVTIHFTSLVFSENININENEVYTYEIDIDRRNAIYNTTNGISEYSLYISSSESVSVYAIILGGSYGDATNVLPVTALGTIYYHCSYTHYTASTYDFMDAYAAVAIRDNTHLYHNGDSVATLNRGQVYYRTSTDMTGSLITANHPFAFFALHQGSLILDGNYSNLIQQLAPVNTWDRTFFVPVTVMEQEIVRIVASQNNTKIIQTGGNIRTGVPGAQISLNSLQAGEFVELAITSNGCFIQSDKPVGVCSYIQNLFHFPMSSNPAQVWIPSIKQTVSNALIAPFYSSHQFFMQHKAIIFTHTTTRDSTKVSIGGMPPDYLSGGSWIEHTTANISFYSMPLINSTASYLFSNPQGIIILGYGIGEFAKGSYYYVAYSAMRELDAAFYTNDIHFQDLIDTTFCAQVVHFRADIENMGVEADSIKWYINGTEYLPAQDSLEWNKTFFTGEYEIKMWVRFENNDTISKTGTLKIKSCDLETAFYANNVHSDILQNVTFCDKVVNFRAEIEGEWVSIKWYINGVEETTASNQETWSKEFSPGEHIGIPVTMEVLLANNEIVTIESTLNVRVLWTQIKNFRH